ncbi:MAG TPA: c-type cytochrome [Pyrinomonadaceae bacterium]|nr:c-type cytochrome [Pyrinomonadaceae bacterium]
MTFSRLAFLLVALAVFVTGCGNAPQTPVASPSPTTSTAASPTPDEFAAVRVIYTKDCLSCHGDKGQGGPTKVDGKTIKVPALNSGHALGHSDKDFTGQIREGGDGMPAFEKKLTPKEIEGIIHFIRKEIQHK